MFDRTCCTVCNYLGLAVNAGFWLTIGLVWTMAIYGVLHVVGVM